MRRLKLFRWAAVLALAIAATPNSASAQEADTLSISGTFHMDEMYGDVGDDFDWVFTNGDVHIWVLTLYGVTYSHAYECDESVDEYYYWYESTSTTRVHATSFDFEFFGPDADVLNEVVSAQLAEGSLTGGGFLELRNVEFFDGGYDTYYEYTTWDLGLSPPDPDAGVSLDCYGELSDGHFSADQSGYPLVEPQRLAARLTTVTDRRPGNAGGLWSWGDVVDISSIEPPIPPSPPTLSILDGSVWEGNRGTTQLKLTVMLSWSSTTPVTVNYATSNGTARAKSDYIKTSGTVTIPPGETQGTIPVSIKGDRKREKDEDFTVRLSDAAGATISDSVATATILNDD